MARIALEQTGVHLNMAAALFGYKRLLCLVFFVVYAVCTINADSSPSGSPTLTTAYSDDGDCKNPWRTHNQSCYLFMAGEYSFAEANKSCSDQRANLVSISDDNENEFIRRERSSTDPAWIGLYRQTSSCNNLTLCDWMWLDGSQLGFYNWPSHTRPTDSKCVLIEPNGFWSNGRSCDADLDLICERDVWYPTTTSETSHSSTYIGVGLFLGIIVTAVIVGLAVYFKRCGGQTINNKATVAEKSGGADYENVEMSSCSNDLVIDHPSMSVGDIYANTLTADAQSRPNNHVDATVYEELTHDINVSPEYTQLQIT